MITGCDYSNVNGSIDAHALAKAGVQFAYVKATEGGSYLDSRLQENVARLTAAGIPFGTYHFGRPGSGYGAAAQAEWYYRNARDVGQLLPVLDLETLDGRSIIEVRAWTLLFLARARELFGVSCTVYGSPAFLQALQLPLGVGSANPLWIAHYTTQPSPTVPLPWTRWTLWQVGQASFGSYRLDANVCSGELPYARPAARAQVQAMRAAGAPWSIVKRTVSFLTFRRLGGK